MPNSDRDFYLKQSSCIEAIEVYKSMERTLEEERENCLDMVGKIPALWSGMAAEMTRQKLVSMLNGGIYDRSLQETMALRRCIEDALYQSNVLLARSEGFTDQLENDDYVEPYVPERGDNRIRNGGVLSIDYSRVGVIYDECGKVIEYTDHVTDILLDVLDECGDLIGEKETLKEDVLEAASKLHRINNYRHSLRQFEQGIRELELDMCTRLRAIMNPEQADEGTDPGAEAADGQVAENIALCMEIEKCLQSGDCEGLQEIVASLLTEEHTIENNAMGSYPCYTLKFDENKIADLVKVSAGLEETPNAYKYMLTLENIDFERVHEADEGSGRYEVLITLDEDNNTNLYIAVCSGNKDEGIWRQRVIKYVENTAILTDAEVVERFETIPDYNLPERVVSRDKNESYNYKQLLAGRYYKIKLQAGRYLGETTGLLKYMPYINGELPYIDGKELEEWNKKQIEAFELYTELEEQGVEIKWIEEYYLFSKRQDIMEDVESYAREREIAASADSVFLKALGAVPGGIYTLGSYLSGNAIDPNSIWFDSIRQAQIIRSTVSDEIAPENADHPRERSKLKELYQCGMGATDLGFATALLQEYGLVLIGAEGYAEAGITGAERGLDGDTIQGEAIAATVCTIVLAAVLKNTGGQSFGESFAAGGAAGGGSYGAGTITDVILAGDTGYIASEYKRYRAAGLSHESAQREVIKNELKRFHISVEEGAFMAGMANVAGKGIAKLGEIGRGKGEAFEGGTPETEGGTRVANFNIDEIRPQLETEPNTAFFWSGKTDGVGGAEVAADIAKGKGGVTLESTIEEKNITMPEWDFSNPSSMDAWDMASAAYAEQVSGEVRAVVGTELRPGNIWENVELPRLIANPNVTKITIIDPKTGIETVIFER